MLALLAVAGNVYTANGMFVAATHGHWRRVKGDVSGLTATDYRTAALAALLGLTLYHFNQFWGIT